MTRDEMIKALDCCLVIQRNCWRCPLRDLQNCRDVVSEEARLALKNSPEAQEARWNLNLTNLIKGAYGDQNDPETLLLYWKAQEAAGYPSASENVKYFTELIEKRN